MAHDVVILGGGLAALTLSLQLKQRLPELDIVVLERRRHPVPQAAHKVGESSVEIAAHYLGRVLGLERHLLSTQLKKFGFRFFFSDGSSAFDRVTELGGKDRLALLRQKLGEALGRDQPFFRQSFEQHAAVAPAFVGLARLGGGIRIEREPPPPIDVAPEPEPLQGREIMGRR